MQGFLLLTVHPQTYFSTLLNIPSNPLGIEGKNSSRGGWDNSMTKVYKMPILLLEEDDEQKLTFLSNSQKSCVERKNKKNLIPASA